MRKLIVVAIEASGRYCSNDCRFMSNDANRCTLFDEALSWDFRKKTNGNSRLPACRKAQEIPELP